MGWLLWGQVWQKTAEWGFRQAKIGTLIQPFSDRADSLLRTANAPIAASQSAP
ncbi:hypothetical protein ACQ4N7_14025 [Nodosilinea sp. AN01ver1]|uniref:hypothetical protein n=1 Tax=Nodosilinea sp. AN01ver1 TaxID=3423362 RepID=UPI003D3217F6